MQNMRRDVVQQIAVMADDDDGGWIAGEIVDQPQRAFEIEIIGRLVEQQQVGLGEQHGGERDAHAPAAGEFRKRALLSLGIKTQAMQNGARARRGGMGLDVGEPRLDFRDLMRIGLGMGALQQRGAFQIGREHEVDELRRPAGRFLLDPAEP